MTTLTAPQADLDALRTPAAAAAHRVAGERPAAASDATPALSVRDPCWSTRTASAACCAPWTR